MTKRRLTSIHVVLGLMAFVCTAAAAPPKKAGMHCVIRLEQGGTELSLLSAPSSTSREPECYSTFQDAIFFATGGSVLLPEHEPFSRQLDILGVEMKAKKDWPDATQSSYVAAVDYQHSNYGGSTLTWTSTGPCTLWTYYVGTSMPSGWNDVVSSTRGYSDCDRNIIFEHQNSGGARITCTPDCSSLGGMNDTASSREFRHLCQGHCGNGQCQAACGEPATCSLDCPTCGNSVCESGENSSNCCQDCGAYCGNGVCQSECGESEWSCPTDCGSGGACNNNGTCDVFLGECASNCPAECVNGELCQ